MLKKYRYDFDQDDNLNKKCKFAQPIYSVDMFCSYVGRRHRTLAVEIENGLIWFWIGTHSDCDKLV